MGVLNLVLKFGCYVTNEPPPGTTKNLCEKFLPEVLDSGHVTFCPHDVANPAYPPPSQKKMKRENETKKKKKKKR